MTVQNQRVFLTPCCGYNMSDLVFGWRKYCFTYKSGEIVKVIYDITLTVACYAQINRQNQNANVKVGHVKLALDKQYLYSLKQNFFYLGVYAHTFQKKFLENIFNLNFLFKVF